MVFSTALKFCGVYVTNSGLLTDVLRWFCPLSSRVPAQLCQGQWASQQKPRALAAAASPSFWFMCKMVLYWKQWVEAITQWPKWLLFLYIFKLFHSIVLRDSHHPPFLPASFLCLPNDMTKKEWVGMFLLDNSFLNRQTDKAWNRNHVAFRLHRSKILISVSEDRVNH